VATTPGDEGNRFATAKEVGLFDEAVRLDPGFAPAHNGVGSALRGKGDTVGAIAAFKERRAPKYQGR